MKTKIYKVLIILLIIFMCAIGYVSVKADSPTDIDIPNIEDSEELDSGTSSEEIKEIEEIEEEIEEIEEIEKDEDAKETTEKGFLEKNWANILSSLGGTLAGLGILFYYLKKAFGKSRELIDFFKKEGKLSEDNANTLNAISEKVETLFCNKLEELSRKYEDQINNVALANNQIELATKEIDRLKETFKNSVKEMENFNIENNKTYLENQEKIVEILKIAFLNDAELVKKGLTNSLERKFNEYEKQEQ